MLETVSGNHHVNKRWVLLYPSSPFTPLPSSLSTGVCMSLCKQTYVPPICRSKNDGADPLLVVAGVQGEACVGVAWCVLSQPTSLHSCTCMWRSWVCATQVFLQVKCVCILIAILFSVKGACMRPLHLPVPELPITWMWSLCPLITVRVAPPISHTNQWGSSTVTWGLLVTPTTLYTSFGYFWTRTATHQMLQWPLLKLLTHTGHFCMYALVTWVTCYMLHNPTRKMLCMYYVGTRVL